MLYRIKQLHWALTHQLTPTEREWIDRALNDAQRPFFYALHPADQAHAFRVAQSVRLNAAYGKLPPWEKKLTAQLALLHDIGRAKSRFLIIKKILHVMFSTLPGLKALAPFKGHEARGAEMMRKAGIADVAELLANPTHPLSKIVTWADNFN